MSFFYNTLVFCEKDLKCEKDLHLNIGIRTNYILSFFLTRQFLLIFSRSFFSKRYQNGSNHHMPVTTWPALGFLHYNQLYFKETQQWMTGNLIKFNESRRCKPVDLPLIVSVSSVFQSDFISSRVLGVNIDKHTTIQWQIRFSFRISFYNLRKITSIRKFLSRCPLQKAQNAAAHVIAGARLRDPMTSHLWAIHWFPMSYRVHLRIPVLTFQCLNGWRVGKHCQPWAMISPACLWTVCKSQFSPPSARVKRMGREPLPTMLLLYGSSGPILFAPCLHCRTYV